MLHHITEFRSGSAAVMPETYSCEEVFADSPPQKSLRFRVFKNAFDALCTAAGLPLVAIVGALLVFVNPLFNPGPVFYKQVRAGLNGQHFVLWKFRTMTVSEQSSRLPNAPLEDDRITALGRFLRKTRIDELPNFINVLRGEMSVVGPRPDAASHALHYAEQVPGYLRRMAVKPGITGLAQVEQGYVEDQDATAVKAKYDAIYVRRLCGRLDLYIIVKTFAVMIKGLGAR